MNRQSKSAPPVAGIHSTHGPTESCDQPTTLRDKHDIKPKQRSATSQRRIDKMHKYGLNHMIAGASAGVFSKTLMQPLDLIKTRMQVQDGRGKNEYKGIRDAFRNIIRDEGVKGLYRGLTPNLIGSGVSWGVYFFTYNQFKELWKRMFMSSQSQSQSTNRLPAHAHLVCAAATGAVNTFITNPIWLIKVRLQLQGKEVQDASRQYKGVIDALHRIVRDEGFLALYRGVGPALVLTMNPALQFTFYEQLKTYTSQYVGGEQNLKSYHFLLMGGTAKGMSATITYPLMNVRSRLYQKKPDTTVLKTITSSSTSAADKAKLTKNPEHKYKNMADVFKKVYMYEGIRGFYRGLSAQLLKTIPASSITFFGYETTLRFIDRTIPTVTESESHSHTPTADVL